MKVDVLTEIEIDRPQTEVARFAGDPSNAPPWYVNIASVNWVTPPPLAVGSRMAFVARFIGRRLAHRLRDRRADPGRATRHANGARRIPRITIGVGPILLLPRLWYVLCHEDYH